MDQDKSLRLLLRQLKDIQVQADKIITGDDSDDTIETFARYSGELKKYISKNVESPEIKSYLAQLPIIDYKKAGIQFWQYLMLISWWVALYANYQAKRKTIEDIGIAKSKYATLELIVKGLAN